MKPAGQTELAGYGEWPQSRVLRMLGRSFLYNVNDTRALIGLYIVEIRWTRSTIVVRIETFFVFPLLTNSPCFMTLDVFHMRRPFKQSVLCTGQIVM